MIDQSTLRINFVFFNFACLQWEIARMRSWSLARPHPNAFHVFSIEAMVRGYHIYKSIWAAAIGEEFEALAKNHYKDIVNICSSASDCVWHRSKVMSARKIFACLNFVAFIFI